MFKRTKGYLLLTLLVLTGLAGRIHSHTLSGKERRLLILELKNTKTDIISSVEGLSARQVNFKSADCKTSIKDYVYRAATVEKAIKNQVRQLLSVPAEKIKYDKVEDQSLAALVERPDNDPLSLLQVAYHPAFSSLSDALENFNKERNDLVRFARTTTDDVRIFTIPTRMGRIDLYQLLLLNTICTHYYTQQIEKIKSSPRFPK